MYDREKTLALPVTVSAQPSNLARLCTGDQVYMAVIHKQQVNIVCVTNPTPQPIRVFPQLASRPFSLTQVQWVTTLSGRHVLVLTGYGGVALYDWDGAVLLKVVNLSNNAEDTPTSIYTRGITGLEGNIAVGSSTGEVIILSSGAGISSEHYFNGEEDEDNITACDGDTVGTELHRIKWHPHAITALASTDKTLAVADIRGNVMVGKRFNGTIEKHGEIESYGSSVSCMIAMNRYLIAGYISGHMRIFDTNTNKIITEVCGHARAVSGVDAVAGSCEGEELRVVSAGEDTFARVWSIHSSGADRVQHLHSRTEPNQLLTGVAFTDDKGNGFVTTAYDVSEMAFFITA